MLELAKQRLLEGDSFEGVIEEYDLMSNEIEELAQFEEVLILNGFNDDE